MNSVSHAYMSYWSVSSPNEKDAFNEILENENFNNTCTETAARCHMVIPHPENDHGIFNDISSNVAGNENKLNENEDVSPFNDDLADIAVYNDVQTSNAESFFNGNSCPRRKVVGFCEYLNICSFILSVCEEQQRFPNVSENFQEEMIHFRTLYPKNLISGHIDINGFRNKFYEISDLLTQSLLDILFVSQTKLDMSYQMSSLMFQGLSVIEQIEIVEVGASLRTYAWSPSPPAGWPRNIH